MKLSLDAATDYSYEELHRFLDLNTLPDFVKSAECHTKVAADALDDEAFADTIHRAFPINNAANVYTSNAYFVNKMAALKEMWGENYTNTVQERITKAAGLLGISEHIEKYNSELNTKEAADYTEQPLVSIEHDSNTYELFHYKTASDVEHQARVFAREINNYPFSWRIKIAQEFVNKATELGIDEIPDLVAKYGGLYLPDVREFENTLSRRMRKLSEEYHPEYTKCIEKAAEVRSAQDAWDICASAYMIEKQAGVYNKPNLYREMGDIVDRTMTLDYEKLAQQFNVVEMDNDTYSINDLQKISKDVYKEAFGCDIDPSDTAQLHEVLPTMPKSDVVLFRELSGIRSV